MNQTAHDDCELRMEEREEIWLYAGEHPEMTAGQVFLHFMRRCVRCYGPCRDSHLETPEYGPSTTCMDATCGRRLTYEQVAKIIGR